tara:strand:- start:373 stop:561 length:189 start_codon:yes stop_codon:yes gene_type:complete
MSNTYNKIPQKPFFDKYHLDCINNQKWIERIMKEKNLSFNYPKQLEKNLLLQAYAEWRKKYE